MKRNKLIGRILQIPLILVVIFSFIASIYVIITNSYPIGIATPIILGIIIALYFIGSYMKRKKSEYDF